MTHKDAWYELKQKIETARRELAVMIVKNRSVTESRRLAKKHEFFGVVQGWMRDIEQSIGYGSYPKMHGFPDVVIDTPESAERFINALEQAEQGREE